MASDPTINMKKTTIIILLTIFTQLTYGQTDSDKRKSLYFEIEGSGGVGSIKRISQPEDFAMENLRKR